MNLFNIKEKTPSRGYKLPSGYGSDYRSTAIAYLEREGIFTVENIDGKSYNLIQLKNSAIRYATR